MFWWTHRYLAVSVPNFDQLGSLSYYGLRVIEQLIAFAIAAFLFISGFFVACATGRSRATMEWKLVGIRIRNLMIPYLFWSVVTFIDDSLQGTTHSAIEYLKKLALGQAADPYYYIILLSQLYLLSPLIVPIARKKWKLLLSVAALVQLVARGSHYMALLGVETRALELVLTMTPNWLFPRRIFWFAFGIVAGFHLQPLKLWLARVRWGLLAAVVILVPLGVLEWEAVYRLSGRDWLASSITPLDNLYAGAFILCFLAFDKVSIPFSRELGEVGTRSLGVYLVHSQVLALVSRIAYHVAPWILACQALFQPMLIVLGLGIPLLLMAVVDRSPARRVYRHLFG